MNRPVEVAKMTPVANTRGIRVGVDVLHLDDIPNAMDNMGWTVSAQLMRRWFACKPQWGQKVGEKGPVFRLRYRLPTSPDIENNRATV